MKTPEEIKKGLAEAPHIQYSADDPSCCAGYDVRYAVAVGYVLREDIVSCIQQLESRLAQAERERDVAVADLRIYAGCKVCKFGDLKFPNDCMDCIRMCNWQWRGVCAENTKEE